MMVLQETTSAPVPERAERQQSEGRSAPVEMKVIAPPVRPYQPRVPYPERLAWTRLLQLEPKYARFLERLRRIYADTLYFEAHKKASACLKYVRDFLAKKGDPEGGSVDGGPSFSLSLITRSKFKSKIQEWVNVLLAQPSELSVWAYGVLPGFVTRLEQGLDLELP